MSTTKTKTPRAAAAAAAAAATTTKAKTGPSVAERLEGSKDFTLGAYKTAHVAHSYASQVRRLIRDRGLAGWSVKTNSENNTIRVSRQR